MINFYLNWLFQQFHSCTSVWSISDAVVFLFWLLKLQLLRRTKRWSRQADRLLIKLRLPIEDWVGASIALFQSIHGLNPATDWVGDWVGARSRASPDSIRQLPTCFGFEKEFIAVRLQLSLIVGMHQNFILFLRSLSIILCIDFYACVLIYLYWILNWKKPSHFDSFFRFAE